jgi:hypothetical protein
VKADRLRAQITVQGDTKILALVIALLSSSGYPERVLKTVCAHFGLRCE